MQWRRVLAAIGLATLGGFSAAAAQTPPAMSFGQWLAEFRDDAGKAGIQQGTLDTALKGVTPIPEIIEFDRKQPEFTLTFAQYIERVAPPARIRKGRDKVAERQELIERIGRQYGVQPRFIAALWGIESDFGRAVGKYSVVQALATLAYDGRRSKYFRGELIDALRILDGKHVEPTFMYGSWAGAMGQCQFMPSSFLNFAADGDGDGRKDIWRSEADVFASTASYLAKSGWAGDQTWGRKASLPSGFDSKLTDGKTRKTLAEWQALGVRRDDGGDLPARAISAGVLVVDSPGGGAFLVYDNFNVIMKWNRSTFFALGVGFLADGIGGGV